MPEHTSFLTYVLALFPGLAHNAKNFGNMAMSKQPVGAHHMEASVAALLVAVMVIGVAYAVKGQLADKKAALEPEDKLTLRTFVEIFVGAFYGIAKDIMGPKRAKQYFPVIGTSALFIFFSNAWGLIPGVITPPTSTLNITLGCALLVAITYNYYGFKENGIGHIKHLFGPWLGPAGIPVNLIIFVIEALTMFVVRPATLAIRLMVNIAVDHLLASVFLGLVALFVPVPIMFLGLLVVIVQTVVFCLLTSIYIGLATEHEEHH